MTLLRAVKGMNDVLPDEIGRCQAVERLFAETMARAGFREVRTPTLEPTPLFVRAIGEATDVVEKEMYSFEHHGEPLTLRPEGTAGAARAYLEHAIHAKEPVTRWWYSGPMFRAERPQRGRYRQFFQLGAEVFGDPGPGCDAEVIDLLVGFLDALPVTGAAVLVNSIGGKQARERYRDALVQYLTPRSSTLSPDSQRRLSTNPLRILDSKDDKDRTAVAEAPTIHEFLDADDQAHFAALRAHLDALGTPYAVDPRLVRGLDYYTRTLFEIKGAEDKLGSGSTLVGGGRYDRMVAELGGPDVPAFGFAMGLERLLLASGVDAPGRVVDAVVVPIGAAAQSPALALGRDLRRAGIRCDIDTRGTSLKSQLRRATALGARFALILGESELREGLVQLKDLDAHSQERVTPEVALRSIPDSLRNPAGGATAPAEEAP
ncbi:MAG: histidine--tRNA ligase [Polyangiaceae bacterium]|jgi:histidyl-tRNA synthetase